MELMSTDSMISRHNYLMARENNIDLKYLVPPSLEVTKEHLGKLPYSYFDDDGPDLRKAANEAFKYHHDRTECNIAHRIRERQARAQERDNDPFYWLSIYLKAQQQLKQTLTLNYRNSGFSAVKKPEVIKDQISVMNNALSKIKNCPGFGTVFKLIDMPEKITVHNDMVIPQSEKARDVESKYLKFCEMYNIDFKYVSEVTVFNNNLQPVDSYYLKEYKSFTADVRHQLLTHGCFLTDDPRLLDFKDSSKTLIYYHLFTDARLSLRNIIAKYMDQGLAGNLTQEQLDNLQKYVASSELAYRLMILSKNYKVGFQVSNVQEYETIPYSSELSREHILESDGEHSISADDSLFKLHQNAVDLQTKIEQEKRKLESIKRHQEELLAARKKIEEEESLLNTQYNEVERSISDLESQFNNLNEEISKRGK